MPDSHWNAQITASVFMAENAPLTVLSAFPLNVPAETGLPGNFKKRNPMSIKREPTENISVVAPIRITKHIWIKILMLLSFKKQIKIRLF